MGFVESVFAQPNPTRRWQFDPAVPLVLDLDQHTLGGIAVGQPLQRLSFLGKAFPRGSCLAYPALGLAVSEADGLIVELIVYFGHPSEPDGGTFAGPIRHRGELLEMSATADEPWLRTRLGEPYWRDDDGEEVILFYEHGPQEWQLELAGDGRLRCLVLCSPLLADEEQRRAYGVTKPWPPMPTA